MKSFLRPLVVAIAIALMAVSSPIALLSGVAQDGELAVSQASPETGAETPVDPAPTGVLRVVAIDCTLSEGEGYLALLLESEFAPGESCLESFAPVFVDGIDFGPASPVLELTLDAGPHTVAEANSGISRSIDVFAEAVSTMWVVNFTVVAVAEEVVTETVTLSLLVHVCEPGVLSADSLLAPGGRYGRLAKCPVITLPGENAPGGSVTAGQDWFDVSVQDASGFSATIVDAIFVPDAICESGLGVELTASPFDDACYSTSRYDLTVPASSLSIGMSSIPGLLRFGYAESDDPAVESAVSVIDLASGAFTVVAGSGFGDPVKVHVYLLSPPELTIVQHLCGEDVSTAADLEALGGFVPRALACPAVTRSVDGGALDFDASVADGAAITHSLGGAAIETWSVCEFELGFDFNGDPNDNACLEMPSYRLTNVTRGLVEIWQSFGSDGVIFGGVDFVPGTGGSATFIASDPASGIVSLDTSSNGDLVIHLYALMAPAVPDPPEATVTPVPTATSTPVPTATSTPIPTATSTPVAPEVTTGSIQIAALYCLGSRTVTTLTASVPGQSASAAELSGDCFGGDAQIQITLANGETQPAFKLGREGRKWIDGLPVSGGANGSHLLTDQISNQSVAFEIQPGAVTRVILRVEVAMGASAGTGPRTTDSPETTSSSLNPLDLLAGLVTDILITDELSGIPHAGTSFEGPFDSNSFVVDLMAGLETDELASVTAGGLPVVGVRDGQDDKPSWALAMAAAGVITAALGGWWLRRWPVAA